MYNILYLTNKYMLSHMPSYIIHIYQKGKVNGSSISTAGKKKRAILFHRDGKSFGPPTEQGGIGLAERVP